MRTQSVNVQWSFGTRPRIEWATEAQPLRADMHLAHVLALAGPGDTVRLARGDYTLTLGYVLPAGLTLRGQVTVLHLCT